MSFHFIWVAVETNTDVDWITLAKNRPHLSLAYTAVIYIKKNPNKTKN